MTVKTRTSIPASAIVLSAHVILGIVSHLAHLRTVRPFSPILLFLLSTLVFDVARCRTLWSVESSQQAAATITVAVACKAVLLVIESLEKRSILLPPYRVLPHESTAGIFNEWFCWWMNPLLLFGYRRTHSLETLYEVDQDLSAEGNIGLSELWAACWCTLDITLRLLANTLVLHQGNPSSLLMLCSSSPSCTTNGPLEKLSFHGCSRLDLPSLNRFSFDESSITFSILTTPTTMPLEPV